jgi:hypothetical protein
VGGSNSIDELAPWSNYGTNCVELVAPGVSIWSDDGAGVLVSRMYGTSMAAPHVAGVAALLKAQEPNRTAAEIRSAILSGVDARPDLAGRVATGGRLNAYTALLAIRPIRPSALAGVAADGRRVVLSWHDDSAGESRYEVQRRHGAEAFAAVADTLAANTEGYTDTTVSELTAYTYRVRAWNSGAASDFSQEFSLTTPLAAPSDLSAVRSAAGVTLRWTDNSAGETGYEIQRRAGSADFVLLASVTTDVSGYTDGNVDPAIRYDYRARAIGPGGNSAFSAEASASAELLVSGAAAGSGGGGGGGCFIATAAYGSPEAAEVRLLRQFRDRYLLTNRGGRLLVAAYYRLSPPLADRIRTHGAERQLVRVALQPVVWWAGLALASPAAGALLAGSALAGSPLVLVWARRARARRRAVTEQTR